MKKILLYESEFFTEDEQKIIECIEGKLIEQNLCYVKVNLGNIHEYEAEIEKIGLENIQLVIDVNYSVARDQYDDVLNFQNSLGVNYCSFLTVNPSELLYLLVKQVANSSVVVFDKSHKEFIDNYFENILCSAYYTPDIFGSRKQNGNRVVMMENYEDAEKILDSLDAKEDKVFIKLTYDIIQETLQSEKDTCLDKYMYLVDKKYEGLQTEHKRYYSQCVEWANRYIRAYMLRLMMDTLIENQVKVSVCGNGWNDSDYVKSEKIVVLEKSECLKAVEAGEILVSIPKEINGSYETKLIGMRDDAIVIAGYSEANDVMKRKYKSLFTYTIDQIKIIPQAILELKKSDCNGLDIDFMEINNYINESRYSVKLVTFLNGLKGSGTLDECSKSSFVNVFSKLINIKTYVKEDCNNERQLFAALDRISDDKYLYFAFCSFLFVETKNYSFALKLLQCSLDMKMSLINRMSVYWYIQRFIFLNGIGRNVDYTSEKMHELYLDMYKEVKENIYNSDKNLFERIDVENRCENKVIVLTGQFLKLEHGPTKTSLDRCECLIKKYGYEVELINTADVMVYHEYMPLYEVEIGFYVDSLSDEKIIEYNGCQIPYYQCSRNMPNIDEIKEVVEYIKEYNPLFIVNIGGNSLVSDLCSEFCDTLTVGTVPSGLSNTLGQYQTLGRRLNDSDREWLEKIGKDENSVIESLFTSSLKPQEHNYTRNMLGLNDEKFVLAIVGGRINSELDDALIEKLLFDTDDDVQIALVGGFDRYDEVSEKYHRFSDKFVNLGFQSDMQAVFDCCDLYVNPKRTGGGTSVAEALYKGIPAVTLPYGDVGLGAGEAFHVSDYDDMIKLINRYKADKEFYHEMSVKAKERAKDLFDTAGQFGKVIDELLLRMRRA